MLEVVKRLVRGYGYYGLQQQEDRLLDTIHAANRSMRSYAHSCGHRLSWHIWKASKCYDLHFLYRSM